MAYEASLESLNAHPVPQWYEDAKFGIFIHWGLFSIPAFAAKSGSIADTFRTNYDIAVAQTPYCEWYWNAIKVPESDSAKHHAEVYGNAPYENFVLIPPAALVRISVFTPSVPSTLVANVTVSSACPS